MSERGRWIVKKGISCYTQCSKCGFEMNNKYFFEPENFKYCPNCGRKMYPRRVYAKVGKNNE